MMKRLVVSKKCVKCKKCRKVCPFELKIWKGRGGEFADPACIKCGRCAAVCKKKAIALVNDGDQ
ncbi:MAG: 4Fe-4S binding protein [Negativicutes bacterium]|nr:4Fe-4S binding protein [Negativicutes bacterium]